MKTKSILGMMAAVSLLTVFSCTKEMETTPVETPEQNAPEVKTYSLSVVAQKADMDTKALSLDGSTLNATWATTENVYVANITPYGHSGTQIPNSSNVWSSNALKPAGNGASTTLTGNIQNISFNKGDLVRLQFPKKGTMSYEGQKGTLADIAANYDYAVAYVNVANVVDNGSNYTITPGGPANFVNQQAIVKFNFVDKATDQPINVTELVITSGHEMLVKEKTYTSMTIINPGADDGWQYLSGYSSDGVNGQTPDKMFTDDDEDKWCSIESQKINGVWTARFNSGEHQVDGYAFATGYDNSSFPGRNPKSWVVRASGNGLGYFPIATVNDDIVLEDYNYRWYFFSVDKARKYNSFGLEISESKGAKANYNSQEVNIMQLGKFRLLTFNYNTTYAPLVVTPESPSSELTVAICNDYVDASNMVSDSYKLVASVDAEKYVYEKSDVTFEKGKYYEITVKMTKVEPYNYSVGENNQVWFAPGNLYFSQGNSTSNSGEWRIFSNAWEYVGNRANNTSPTLINDDRLDLFCWGANGLNSVHPNTLSEYLKGEGNLSGTDDWGSVILQNYNLTGCRTLRNDEWDYLIKTRKDAPLKMGFATISPYDNRPDLDVRGMVLLPDAWICPDGCSFTPASTNGSSYSYDYATNKYTRDEWDDMAIAGAVFLPAAGTREGSSVIGLGETNINGYADWWGYYWTSTGSGETMAYYVWFSKIGGYNNSAVYGGYNNVYTTSRANGLSVRLVHDVK